MTTQAEAQIINLDNAIGEYDRAIDYIVRGVKLADHGQQLIIGRTGESVSAGRLAALVNDRNALRQLIALCREAAVTYETTS